MKKYENGQYLAMTAEEMAALGAAEPPQPTVDERLAALEAAMLEQIMGVTV